MSPSLNIQRSPMSLSFRNSRRLYTLYDLRSPYAAHFNLYLHCIPSIGVCLFLGA